MANSSDQFLLEDSVLEITIEKVQDKNISVIDLTEDTEENEEDKLDNLNTSKTVNNNEEKCSSSQKELDVVCEKLNIDPSFERISMTVLNGVVKEFLQEESTSLGLLFSEQAGTVLFNPEHLYQRGLPASQRGKIIEILSFPNTT